MQILSNSSYEVAEKLPIYTFNLENNFSKDTRHHVPKIKNLIDILSQGDYVFGILLNTSLLQGDVKSSVQDIHQYTKNNIQNTMTNLISYLTDKEVFESESSRYCLSYNGIDNNEIEGEYEMSENEIKKKEVNINKLNQFSNLTRDWNGYGAEPFTDQLIKICLNLIEEIKVQPKVFPTGRDSIQFEYEKDSGKYLELEVFEDHTEVFYIHEDGREEEYDIKNNDINKINKVVLDFNG